jgi:hypothetical protein
VPLENLVLMPETQARRALSGEIARFRVLAPLGAFAGQGVLRVLRARACGGGIELVCGYESYDPL